MNELDEEARRIVALARRARTPSAADRARIEARLGTALGASLLAGSTAAAAQAGGAGGAAAKSLGVTALLKWVLGGGVVAGMVLGGYVAATHNPPQTPTQGPAVPVERSAAVPETVPEAVPDTEAGAELEAETHGGALSAQGDSLAAEVELLHRAQAAWRARDAETAQRLLQSHQARFPRSQLRLERDALRVLTLCELGRQREAKAVARAFVAAAPHSPLRATVEQSCAFE